MLNISPYPTPLRDEMQDAACMNRLKDHGKKNTAFRRFAIAFSAIVLFMFVPWTQNITAPGRVISRFPDKKPQEVNSMIDGRIVRWLAYEGKVVKSGDTLAILEEVTPEYLDPDLLRRSQDLVDAKVMGINAYQDKLKALQQQETALINSRDLELTQVRLKIRQSRQQVLADSAQVSQEKVNQDIAQERLDRAQELFKDGLLSTTDFETRRLGRQEAEAKLVKAENDLLSSRQSYDMSQIEVAQTAAEYADKIAKNRSEQASTAAAIQDAIAERTKLENLLSNYARRQSGQVVLAPQGGRVIAMTQSGVGEIIKAGSTLATIQPLDFVEAVELYVDAMDVPLVHGESTVRLQFDGWPALVFSGWPNASVGTFPGEVVSVDQVINKQGKYRVIIVPKEGENAWPRPLSIGSGAFGMILLKDVPLGYELWRQINGFPPEFYTAHDANASNDE